MLIYLYIRSETAETLRLWRRYDRLDECDNLAHRRHTTTTKI